MTKQCTLKNTLKINFEIRFFIKNFIRLFIIEIHIEHRTSRLELMFIRIKSVNLRAVNQISPIWFDLMKENHSADSYEKHVVEISQK